MNAVSPWFNPKPFVPGTRALADQLTIEFQKVRQAFDLLPDPTAIAIGGGMPNYTWVAWADSADGTQNFTTVAPGNRAYRGEAVNKTVQAPSNNPEDYVWMRISGSPGAAAPGVVLQYSVDGLTNWHSPYVAGDRYWRQSVDGGVTFSPGARLSAATLAELDLAASNALAAAGTDIVNLQSSVGNVTASISAEASTRASADTALSNSLTSLTATVNSNQASLTSQLTTQSSNLSALSSSVTTLTTTVNGHTASISSFAVSINGLQAKAGLTLDVDGYIIGWELNNAGGSGEAIFRVDKFKIASPDGLSTPFEVIDDTVYIKSAVIKDLSIGTSKISAFAIRKTYFSEIASSVSMPVGSGRVRVVSVVVTKDEATSDLEVRLFMRPRPGNDYAGYFVVGANAGAGDTDLDTIWFWAPSVVVAGLRSLRIPVAYFRRFTGYGPGTYTFYVDLVTYGGGTAGSFIEAGSNLLVEEMKR